MDIATRNPSPLSFFGALVLLAGLPPLVYYFWICLAFYIVYFVVLLVHRERRDHTMCLAKYGEDWTAYCRRVRWRILPGVY